MRTDVKIGIAVGVFVLAIVGVIVAYQKSRSNDGGIAKNPNGDTPVNVIDGGNPKPAPSPAPTLPPSPTATPSPTPTLSPSPTPTSTPVPSISPIPTLVPVPTLSPTPTPTPTPTPSVNADKTYTVQAGDTGFYSIAARPEVYGDAKLWEHIAKANPSVKSNQLRQGMTLVIPRKPDTPERPPLATTGPAVDDKNTYVVKSGDSYWKIAQEQFGNGKYMDLIQKANPGVSNSGLRVGMRLKLPPKPADASGTATSAPAGTVVGASYMVKAGDTLQSIAQSQYGDQKYWSLIARANSSVASDGTVRPGQTLTLPPASSFSAPPAVIRVAVGGHTTTSAPATSRPRATPTPTPSPTPRAAKPTPADDGKPVFD